MSSRSFVHLHLHSQYSLLEATCQAKKLVAKTKDLGMPAVALTDNGNMFGAVEFYFAAKDAGVKPILGMDAYLAPKSRLLKGQDRETTQSPNRRLVLLAKDFTGYQSLCRLSTIGFQEGFYYKPRLDHEVLRQYSQGLIALSGGSRGDVAYVLESQGPEAALERVRLLSEIFPESFYLELNRTGGQEWDKINSFLIEASKITGVPLVAANNVHYLEQEEQIAQEVLICIGSNKTLHDESRYRLGSDQFYFKSAEQMRQLFKDIPEACDRTLEIAERCDVKFKLKDDNGKSIYHLPKFTSEDGRGPSELIQDLALLGLEDRFKEAEARGEKVLDEKKPEYFERLKYELGVIEKMGFTSYFLIVQDFINWAKQHQIPVGPGRGSGAGSLVAFSLKITDLDPVKYSLLFERFLNPERISMPDFDIDFCQDKRDQVIQYVTQKYGADTVSQIITYGKLQARAAIRDVGRVLGMSFSEVDVIAKLMPDKLGVTLDEALELEPRIREQMELSPTIDNLMNLARKIEGLVRHAGIHAAGVIIADMPLIQLAPLYRGADNESVLQYDMKYAEKIGLIKFDFLGLKTLTHIQRALDLVEANRGKKILPQDIPLSDPNIYAIMAKGDTAGIFQFEGEGITDTVRKIKPNCFEDITAINALYRPGPMDMIPEYTKRKHGEAKISYLFPELEEILKETYGIIIYQEQVMAIASRIANYSLGEADMLRRAMGKKIQSEMDAQKERFSKGAAEQGFDAKKSEELFELMQEFANYGFNKSHAAAYCVVAAQTAWLKHYYPVEFYAALLSTEMSDTDNVVKYVKDARSHGIKVEPPNINYSEYKFTVKDDTIFFSLGAIKGVGEAAVDAIIEARSKLPEQKFASLAEFFENVDMRRVNKKVVEALIKAGAFDGFGAHRAQLAAGFEKFIANAESIRSDRERGQVSLFSLVEDIEPSLQMQLPEVEPWSRTQTLANERETLGFYLSDHPLQGMENVYKNWVTCPIAELASQPLDSRVVLVGLVSEFRDFINKKGARMGFGKLEDLTGSIPLTAFPEPFAKAEYALKSEQPVMIGGQLRRREALELYVDRAALLSEVIKKSKEIVFRLNPEHTPHFKRLNELLRAYPGTTAVTIELEVQEVGHTVQLEISDFQGIDPVPIFFEKLHSLCGHLQFLELKT